MPHRITRHEIEDLGLEALIARRSALMEDLLRTQRWHAERTIALASLETVTSEICRKQARLR